MNYCIWNIMFFWPCIMNWLYSILITNLMHWLLFIHKIIYSSTCFKPQVLIFRRIQLCTCSIWYCHSLWEFLVVCRYTAWAVYRQATKNSHREWLYHMLHVHNCILLKMSTWGSKHVEENIILWINNNQCIKLVINYTVYETCPSIGEERTNGWHK